MGKKPVPHNGASEAATVNFKCGHPRSGHNIKVAGGRSMCRTCYNARMRAYKAKQRLEETHAERYERHRIEYLPSQLEAARRKVEMLENEARRYGMTELLAA